MTYLKQIYNKFHKYLSLDLRALALMRILFGLLIISDIYIRSTALVAHYTDDGVLPRELVYSNWDSAYHYSVHLLSGEAYFQALLFIIAGIIGLLLIFGFKTRLVTFLAWIMMISLQNRNPLLLQGGDIVFRLVLFWGIFLPWGKYFSVDSLRSGISKRERSKHEFCAGTFAFMIQLLLIYYFSAILKSGYEWHQGASAVYFTLSLDQFTTPLGKYFLKFPEILKLLTRVTWYFEQYGPFLYLTPIFRGALRTALVFAFIGMHISFAATLHLGLFSWIMVAAWIGLLPPEFMDLIGNAIRKILSKPLIKFSIVGQFILKLSSLVERHRKPSKNRVGDEIPILEDIWELLKPARIFLYNALVILFLVTVLLWNARSVKWEVSLPYNIDKMARIIRLDQYWNMFAPFPLKDDGWYVVVGEFKDGHSADLFQEKDGVDWDKPNYVAKTYENQRWRKYMMNLWSRSNSHYRAYYLSYLCRYPTVQYDEPLDQVSMYFILEKTLPDYQESQPEPILLQYIDCYSLP